MAQKINEKQLEQIVSEAATLALERLSFIAESKGKKTMTEEKINEAVNESLKMVLKESIVRRSPGFWKKRFPEWSDEKCKAAAEEESKGGVNKYHKELTNLYASQEKNNQKS